MGEVCLFVGLHIHAWLRPLLLRNFNYFAGNLGWGNSGPGEKGGLAVMLVTGVRPSWSMMSP